MEQIPQEQKTEPFLASFTTTEKLGTETPTTSITPNTQFRGRYEKPNCAVCNEVGDGLHFGAEACRACTAFFRRSVALSKKYECRAGRNCEVSSNIRCMCRSCRYDKCIEVGMNPECVQNRRENDTPKADLQFDTSKTEIRRPIPNFNIVPQASAVPSTSNFMDFSIFKDTPISNFSAFSPASLPGLSSSPSLETMPLLERMRINYDKMENARNVIHRREGENIFQQKVPRAITFREATEVTTKEVSLVADWIEWCFDDFGLLPVDQKTILFQNFFVFFCMLERAFMTVKSGRDGIVVMASKDYIDYDNLEGFFKECNSGTGGTPAEIAKPSFELQKRSLINLMRLENVDSYEFFALCVMLFWDFGLEGQSDECNEVGRRVKHRVTREMTFYLRNVKKHEEPLYRMASVVSILPSLQRAVRRFQEDIEMANIFNIYALPENFVNIINGKFN
ncbi:Nuclear receptor [Caenorhabditis elegans]|uniref:Nuclear receptor n=1 Tax=Caenorhabditis elegans TaxID=6239 RepID=I2HAH0_CAEEL|nr:Nuclear receptor [Caenorhabditis elegans]CCH63898.1 Nuclear receptor [Caenorhabditis elegans]|eukprot:NP_001263855.1 Nuclear hormone receptor family member nhr-12 [Caenorhabditis elegans]